MCSVFVDDIFLPSDEATRSESDDFDHEIEEFKRSVVVCQLRSLQLNVYENIQVTIDVFQR